MAVFAVNSMLKNQAKPIWSLIVNQCRKRRGGSTPNGVFTNQKQPQPDLNLQIRGGHSFAEHNYRTQDSRRPL